MRKRYLAVGIGLILLASCTTAPATPGTPAKMAPPTLEVAATAIAADAAEVVTPAAEATATAAQTTAPVEAATEATATTSVRAGVTAAAAITATTVATATVTTAETIDCTPGALTPAQTEGPYYTANPPERSSLVDESLPGTRLAISGYVLDETCRPIPGARVDFWQADSAGQYDNAGYTLRGYQLTDAQGRYSVETVVPGLYTGRTRHIHVKVTPPDGPELTTQLYFPDEPANSRDQIFAAQNVLAVEKTGDRETATFNFVVHRR